jgi:hypothetical protein
MRVEPVNEVLGGLGRRVDPSKQQEAERMAFGVVAIFGIVDEAEAVLSVAEAGLAESGDLKESFPPNCHPCQATTRSSLKFAVLYSVYLADKSLGVGALTAASLSGCHGCLPMMPPARF